MYQQLQVRSTKRRNTPGELPLNKWIREHPDLDSRRIGLDVQDIDFILHFYVKAWLMSLEIKHGFYYTDRSGHIRHNVPDFAQDDTQSVVSQLFHIGSTDPTRELQRKIPNRPTRVTFYGHHVVQLERTTPDNGSLRIDGITYTPEQFVEFLTFTWPLEKYLDMERTRDEVFRIRECTSKSSFDTVREHFKRTLTPNNPDREVYLHTYTDQWLWSKGNQQNKRPEDKSA